MPFASISTLFLFKKQFPNVVVRHDGLRRKYLAFASDFGNEILVPTVMANKVMTSHLIPDVDSRSAIITE